MNVPSSRGRCAVSGRGVAYFSFVKVRTFLLFLVSENVMGIPVSTLLAQTSAPNRPGVDLGNMENFFSYSIVQWNSVSHVLTLGVGIFAAALVYFLATIKFVAPKYRMSNILSGVVMISAMIILLRQSMAWDMSFVLNSESGEYVRRDGQAFSNGYRYMNWSIDVPVLLLQMLVVLPLAAKKKLSYATQFVVAGLGMIWTSWAAQFYETGGVTVDGAAIVEGSSSAPFWIWYFLGWAFYVWIVVIVWKTIREGIQLVPQQAGKILNAILWVFLVAWTAYAVAIVLPQFWFAAEAGVARAFIFTIADVVSKAIYGVMLGMVAVIISREEGYDYNRIRPQMIETDGG